MKTRSEILATVRRLIGDELRRRCTDAAARKPCNCRYNHSQPADFSDPSKGNLGYCMWGSQGDSWQGNLCLNEDQVAVCPEFDPHLTRDIVVLQLSQDLEARTGLPEALQSLLWVLDEGSSVSWWHLFWWRLTGRLAVAAPEPRIDLQDILKALDSSDGKVRLKVLS